jgi:hypothetical protein
MVVARVVIWGVIALVMRMCRVRLVSTVLRGLPCGRLSVLTEVLGHGDKRVREFCR